MKTRTATLLAWWMLMSCRTLVGGEVSLESAPPVVVKTVPVAGAIDVDPALAEIRVTFSKAMMDGSWSWSTWGEDNYPETSGAPKYLADNRTCVLPVKLRPQKFYAIWLNSDQFQNFKDAAGRPAVPYLLTFFTGASGGDATELTQQGWQLWQGGRPAEAVPKFELAVQRDAKNAAAWNGLGWANFNSGKPEEALAAFRKVIELEPGHPAALNGLGQVYLAQGKLADAETFLLKAGAKAPAAWFGLARLYLLQGKFEQAEKWAEMIVDSGQADETARAMLRAAKARKLNEGLRLMIEPVTASATAISTNHNSAAAASDAESSMPLNEDQRAVLAWTDRQFSGFFDHRKFDGWSDEERAKLETKSLDALNGPRSGEYFQAINTLAALRSAKAAPKLRAIAFERVDRNNRDRWMAVRALGLLGDREAVPDLIHLVYHGNVNTRWWAQISLVRITGQNFGKDWNAWGNWWNEQKGEPPYKPEIIRWWNGQAEPDQLAASLDESDQKFLTDLKQKAGGGAGSSGEQYLEEQTTLAQAGNYWAKFRLWEAYSKGTRGVRKNAAEAEKWLTEVVKGAYLAKFEAANYFNPRTPKELLDSFSQHCRLRSGRESLGGASFFRTTNKNGKLVGSFLTELPDEFKKAVEQHPNLKLISIEKLTPKMFLAHESSKQESL